MQTISRSLASKPVTKRYRIAEVPAAADFSRVIMDEASRLHDQHAMTPPGLSCRLSIGLVRVAKVKDCMEVAEAIRQDGRFVVCAYHAQDVAQRRAWREMWMDRVLSRNDSGWIEALREIYPKIHQAIGDVRLVIVATPVEEVGRDHDFDWAVIEPSSMHSIIQTSGRVNRHRRTPIPEGIWNISILSKNKLALERRNSVCFVMPGLETEDAASSTRESTHPEHDLRILMRPEGGHDSDAIDASLVFDVNGRKVLFSARDEYSIKQQIEKAMKVINREHGHETGFMLKKYASAYPLREGAQPEIFLIKDGGFYKSRDPSDRCGEARVKPLNPENSWLCPADLEPLSREDGSVDVAIGRSQQSSTVSRIVIEWHGATCE
jgi:CRISPR-associated endonuclease/helicase Cas3